MGFIHGPGPVQLLPKIRNLGRSEQLSAVAHDLGFFYSVGMTAHYSAAKSTTFSNLRPIIYAALARVIKEHSILSAIPVNETSIEAYFARLPLIDLKRCVHFMERTQSFPSDQDHEVDKILQDQHNTNFKSDYGDIPFWRLIVIPDSATELAFTACFIFHHSLGDGAAGLVFHQAFGKELDNVLHNLVGTGDIATCVEIPPNSQLLPTLEDVHPLPLNPSPIMYKKDGLQEWFGNDIRLPSITHYRTLYLSQHSSTAFAQRCKENNFTVTSGLQSALARAIFDVLPDIFEALTGIIPINLRPWLDLPEIDTKGVMGSFIDAIKVQTCRACYASDGIEAAQHTAESVKHYLTQNLSPTGEPYTSVAFFKGIPNVAEVFKSMVGTPRDSAFEISNVGRFANTLQGAQFRIGRMIFSRSAVAMGAALTTSVVSGGDGAMTVGFSWQEGVIEERAVGQIVANLNKYLIAETF